MQTADDLLFGVVVISVEVFPGVEPGKALHPLAVERIIRLTESVEMKRRQALAVVLPIERGRVLAPIHAVLDHRNFGDTRFGVLQDVPFPGALVVALDRFIRAECIEQGPGIEVLRRIVGTVVATPALDALQVTAIIEVAMEECLDAIRTCSE